MTSASATPSATTASAARDRRWSWLLGVVVSGVVIDQWSKLWAEQHVRGHGVQQVIEGFFDLRFARNAGAFFSMGSELPELVRRSLFVVAAIGASLWMTKLYRDSSPPQRRARAALALLISGAIGNLIDRVRSGAVTDFLHLHFGDWFHWATFNAADIYIAAGLFLLVPELFSNQSLSSPPSQSEAHSKP